MSEIELREYLERIICDYKKLVDARFESLDRALKLQAEKDLRHFEALNHEQARLLADRERYLPRETYAADRKDKGALTLAWISIALNIVLIIVTALAVVGGRHA